MISLVFLGPEIPDQHVASAIIASCSQLSTSNNI